MPAAVGTAGPITPKGSKAMKGKEILDMLKVAAGQAQQIRGEILALRMQQHVTDQEQHNKGAGIGDEFAEPPTTAIKGFSEGGFQAPRLDAGKWDESGERQASPKAPADDTVANQLAMLLKNMKDRTAAPDAKGMPQVDLIASMLASAKKPEQPSHHNDAGAIRDVHLLPHTLHPAAKAAQADSRLTSVVDGLMYGISCEQLDTATSGQGPSIGIVLDAADGFDFGMPGFESSKDDCAHSNGTTGISSQTSSMIAGRPQPAASSGMDAVLMGSPMTAGAYALRHACSQASAQSTHSRPFLDHASMARILRRVPAGSQQVVVRRNTSAATAVAVAAAQPPQPPAVTKMDVLARLRKANEAFNKKHAIGGGRPRLTTGSEDGVAGTGPRAGTGKGDLYQKLLARNRTPAAVGAGAVAAAPRGRSIAAKIAGAPQWAARQQVAAAQSPDPFAAITRQQQQAQLPRVSPLPSPQRRAAKAHGRSGAGAGMDSAALADADAQGVVGHGYVIVSRRGTRHSDTTATSMAHGELSQPHNSMADCAWDGNHGSHRPSTDEDGGWEAARPPFAAMPGTDMEGQGHVSLGNVPARLREQRLTPARTRYDGATAAALPSAAALPDAQPARGPRRLHFAMDRPAPGSTRKAGVSKARGAAMLGGRPRAVSAGRVAEVTRWGGLVNKDKPKRARATTPGRLVGVRATMGLMQGDDRATADRARILKAPAATANAAATRRAKSAPHTRNGKSLRKPTAHAAVSPALSPWMAHELVGDGQGLKWRTTSLAFSSAASSPVHGSRVGQMPLVGRTAGAIGAGRGAAPMAGSRSPAGGSHAASSTAHQPTAWRGMESMGSQVTALRAASAAGSNTHQSPLRAAMARVQLMDPPSPTSTTTPASKRSLTYNGPSPVSSFSMSPTHSTGPPASVSPGTRMRGYANAAAALLGGNSLGAQAAADAAFVGHTTSTHHAQPRTATCTTPTKAAVTAAAGSLTQAATAATTMPPGTVSAAMAGPRAVSPRAGRSLGASAGAVGTLSPRAGASTGAASAGHTRTTEDMALSAMSAITKKAPDAGPTHGNLVGLSPEEVLRRTLRRDGPAPRASPIKPHAATLNLPPHLAGFRGPGGAASYAAAAAAAAVVTTCTSPVVPRYAQSTAASAAKASPQSQLAIILSKGSPGSKRRGGSASKAGCISSAGSSPGTTLLRTTLSRRDAGSGACMGSPPAGCAPYSPGAVTSPAPVGEVLVDEDEVMMLSVGPDGSSVGGELIGLAGVIGEHSEYSSSNGSQPHSEDDPGAGQRSVIPPSSIAKLVHDILQKHSSEAAALDLNADMLLAGMGLNSEVQGSEGTASANTSHSPYNSRLPTSIGAGSGSGAAVAGALMAAAQAMDAGGGLAATEGPTAHKALAAASSPLITMYPPTSAGPRVTLSASNTPRNNAPLPPSPTGTGLDTPGGGTPMRSPPSMTARSVVRSPSGIHTRKESLGAASDLISYRQLAARAAHHKRSPSLGAAPLGAASPLSTPGVLGGGSPLSVAATMDELSMAGTPGLLPCIPSSHEEALSLARSTIHSFQMEGRAAAGLPVVSTPHGAVLLEALPRALTIREALSALGSGLTAGVSVGGDSEAAPVTPTPRGLGLRCFGLCLGRVGRQSGRGGVGSAARTRIAFEVGGRTVALVRRGPSGFVKRNLVHSMSVAKGPWATGSSLMLRCGPTEESSGSQPPSRVPSPRDADLHPHTASSSGLTAAALAAAAAGRSSVSGHRPLSNGTTTATTIIRVTVNSATEHALVVLGLNAALLNVALPAAMRMDEGTALRSTHWLRND